MVAPVEYDPFGREQFKYLPFAANSTGGNSSISDGLFKLNPFQQQQSFYEATTSPIAGQGETFYYGQTRYEASPLNRVEKSLAPGDSWVKDDRGVSQKYWINTANDGVRIWEVTNSTTGSFGSYTTGGTYPAGELYKNVTEDERGSQVIEFKDKEGKVVLKKVQLTATPDDGTGRGHDGWLSTYYLYDDLGQLRGVIQPKGVGLIDPAVTSGANWSLSTSLLEEQCFRYEYDHRGRMIQKKVPGASEVHMVYDKRDRLTMFQDYNLGMSGRWQVTIYDNLNRPVKTGLWSESNNRSYHEGQAAATTNAYYPFTSEPSSGWELLTQTGYDDYTGLPSGSGMDDSFYPWHNDYFITSYNTAPFYAQPIQKSLATRGMVTWTATKVLGSSQYLYTVIFYDEKGRTLQVKSKNISGAVDITTTQYNFSGQPLQTALTHSNGGQGYVLRTQFHYDALGRLSYSYKNINEGGWTLTYTLGYDALGQLKTKKLAPNHNSGAGLETLTYDYNIRGWMLGANRDYAKQTSSTTNYFGFDLGYDKADIKPGSSSSIGSYTTPQYNGNIGGTVWKSKGDNEIRKYDFSYDAVNRITGAGFTQYTGGTFNQTAGVDFTLSGMSYDGNGNIGSMQHKGLKLTGSEPIDNLSYTYLPNSNKLQAVIDAANDQQSKLGDFKYDPAGKKTTDYSYDPQGNLISDVNKGITSIQYNHLNLPETITITGKGTIQYTYDAGGAKLKKVTTDNTGSTTKVTTTLYLSGIYENDVLQFLSHEEGRVRPKRDGGGSITGFSYDYMLKDHLGNVRMVLTDEERTDAYPAASMETAQSTTENALYSNINSTREDLPSGYPSDSYTTPNDKVAKVSGSGNKIGPSIILRVMSGDRFHVRASSWYKTYGSSLSSPADPLSDLITALSGSIGGIGGGHTGATASALSSGTIVPSSATSFLGSQPYNTTKPKAYLNWVLLDEQFKYVSSSSGAEQVGDNEEFKVHLLENLPVTKNGYLYVYVSNATPNLDVFFDNLQVTHIRGAILEETHYYPFGLAMAGISSKAAGAVENKRKYNGIEFENDLEVNTYDAHFRELDPQIARWWQIDPVTEGYEHISPYASMYDNPITFMDPLGDEGEECCKEQISNAINFVDGAMLGMGIGAADNLFGTNIRGQVSAVFVGTGSAGRGWNTGLTIADAGGVVFGVAEIVTGGGMALGGGLLTTGTVGIATPVSAPVAAAGAAVAVHGVFTTANSANNLVNQNGKVNASSNSQNESKNPRNKPQETGTPNSSRIEKRDANGKTSQYSTYGKDGNIRKQVRAAGAEAARHGISGATKKVPVYNTNPSTGQKFRNGFKIQKASKAETPTGQN